MACVRISSSSWLGYFIFHLNTVATIFYKDEPFDVFLLMHSEEFVLEHG